MAETDHTTVMPPGRIAAWRLSRRRLSAVVALASAWTLLPSPAGAQPHAVGVVTTLIGTATVLRAAATRPLRFTDGVFDGDTITTAEKSIVRVLVGCKAIVTAGPLSELTIIGAASGMPGLRLSGGTMGLAVARHLMSPGEAVQISTPNARVAARGASVVIEIRRGEAGADVVSVLSALSGPVDVLAGGVSLQVGSGQRVRVRDATLGAVEELTVEESSRLTANLKGETRQHSAITPERRGILRDTGVQTDPSRTTSSPCSASAEGRARIVRESDTAADR